MKNIIFVSVCITFLVFVNSCQKSPESVNSVQPEYHIAANKVLIANLNHNLYFSNAQFIQAFNESNENDLTASTSFISIESGEYYLTFIVDGASFDGASYELMIDGNNDLYIDWSTSAFKTKTHTCAGAPCESCEMSSTFWTKVRCKCDDGASESKCNHTVSVTFGITPLPSHGSLGSKLLEISRN